MATKTDAPGKWFGAAVKRKEDAALLTGRGRFVDDIAPPDVLHAAFTRSPYAHAIIRSIDTSVAKALPGVHAVLTWADLPPVMRDQRMPLYVPNPAIRQVRMQHILAKEECCIVGEPVAIVIADNRYIAEDAAALVVVDYDVLPAVCDVRTAFDNAKVTAHAGASDNIAARIPMAYGDIDAAFRNAPHVFTQCLFQHRGGPFFIETRGLIVEYEPASERLTAHIACQGAHRLKRAFMDMLDFGDDQVRIIAPDVGGGFGPKGSYYCEYGAVAAAAMLLGRPVKWIEDRRENFLITHQERDQWWDLEIAVNADATLRGLRGRLVHDNGAYLPWGLVLPWIAATTVPGPYVLPAYHLDLVVAMTNKTPCTPVRGAGRPQAVFAMERMMDLVARELGLDRAECAGATSSSPSRCPTRLESCSATADPLPTTAATTPSVSAGRSPQPTTTGFPSDRRRL